MRYILDDNGYVESVSCNHIECDFKGCTEYKGLIPLGYYNLEEWATKGNIRAYKIVDSTFTYDPDRAAALQLEIELSNNEVVLYDNADGSNATITLKDNIDNYDYVDIYFIGKFEDSGDSYCYTKMFNPSKKRIELMSNTPKNQPNAINLHALITMSGTTLSWLKNFMCYVGNGAYAGNTTNCIRICKIIGYKHKLEIETFEEPDLSIDANIPKEEPTRSIVIAENWVNYNNGSPEGTMAYNNLDVWMYNWDETNNKLDGVSLDFTIVGAYTMQGAFTFSSYEGCPRNVGAYIFKDSVLYKELPYQFDSKGTAFDAIFNEKLDTGSYQLVLGAYPDYEFGVSGTVNFV